MYIVDKTFYILNIDFRLLGACVLIVYLAVLYGAYVPDWHFMVDDPNSVDFGKILRVSL